MEPVNIFISYSHADEAYKDRLEKHLNILQRNGIVSTWNDRKIGAGEEWDKKIKSEIETAQIILLLISVDFLSSNYCYDIEIKRAIERHDRCEAVVIPVILRKCDWKDTAFGKLQALPKDAVPVKSFPDEDEALYSIVEGIKRSISQLKEKQDVNSEKPNSNSIPVTITNRIKVECDQPPNILYWVGRSKEISEMDLDLHKVIFISGIGGQGKSGLASYYVKSIAPRKLKWEFWDWRDCQEKENRIYTKIISIIYRLSNNRIQPNQIADAGVDDLIELLFEELGSRRIIFVFDNIDAYVEFENFQLIGAVEKLYKAALSRNHNSKFIFTCRSSIEDIDTELLTIKLHGLTEEETLTLFSEYQLNLRQDEVINLARKSFSLTKGHPLWLNLIAAQARRGLNIAEKFIKGITQSSSFEEDNLSSILSNKILSVIWESLNEKQRTLLMAFAEIVKAETQDNLTKILDSELNYNQFLKAFRALRQLNLIVVKSLLGEQDTFELHPLVKEYVITHFGRIERDRYISLFVSYYDSVIIFLKSRLSAEQPLSFYENWTVKIELAVNKDDFKVALLALEEVSYSICDAGYVEEYIRVATLVFLKINWETALHQEYNYFNSQFSKFVDTLTEFGKFSEAEFFFLKYEKYITNKDINYIRFCRAKAHFLWFQSRYEEAIKLAQTGIQLEEQGATKSGIDLKHTLALALRDTKEENNISKALDIFLNDQNLALLLENETTETTYIAGETYGNVGRCLQFIGNTKDAITCFKKSLRKIDDSMNKGYGYLWYGECLESENKLELTLWFYKYAANTWSKVSPVKVPQIEKRIKEIIEMNKPFAYISEASEKEVSNHCNAVIEEN